MPRRDRPHFSKKIKQRAPVRQAFVDKYVKNDPHVLSARFSHWRNQDYLRVEVDGQHMELPEEFMGYPLYVKVVKKRREG